MLIATGVSAGFSLLGMYQSYNTAKRNAKFIEKQNQYNAELEKQAQIASALALSQARQASLGVRGVAGTGTELYIENENSKILKENIAAITKRAVFANAGVGLKKFTVQQNAIYGGAMNFTNSILSYQEFRQQRDLAEKGLL